MTSRAFLLPLVACISLGCGSSNADFTDDGTGDTGAADTTTGGDGNTTDSSPTKDTNGGGDGTAKDTGGGGDTTPPPDDATPTDTTPPPTDTPSTCAGTDCGGTCVDLSTDPKNCGGCGTAVCHMEICKAGAPACYPGFKACGGTGCFGCRDIKSDPVNCGDCGVKCGTGQTCAGGTCSFVTGGCSGGLRRCGGIGTSSPPYCADTDRDPANCGDCGTVCGPTQICVGGKCETYTSAPGCSTCPCAACVDPLNNCCTIDGFGGPRCVGGDCP